jgi:hypothetical protein
MLKAINTKILLAILAALTAIGGALTYQRHEAFRQRVEQDRKRHSSAAAHEGKTWRTYIP